MKDNKKAEGKEGGNPVVPWTWGRKGKSKGKGNLQWRMD